jgi:cyclophilin family peptidyl-prolyl cis-trans isomerase
MALIAPGEVTAMNPMLLMTTSLGIVRLELFPSQSPVTVANFLAYVEDRFYDGTLFHRVVPQFMIQGGGYQFGMRLKHPPRAAIRNESSNGLTNKRGTVAMARKADPNSANCQFFINLVDNRHLNPDSAPDHIGQCVFGKTVDGMEVVDAIATVRTGNRARHEDVPLEDVVIQKIRRLEPIDPSWRTADVVSLAQDIYIRRSFDILPILADALEEAGCTNPSILEHCRSASQHGLGCWVVDLVLAKE